MPGEIARESSSGSAGRHDLRQGPTRERRPEVPAATDPAKDAPLTHRRRREPAAQRPDRTAPVFGAERNRHRRAGAFAIGLRAPDSQAESVR